MGKLIDLTGKKFGKLTVIRRFLPNRKRQHKNGTWGRGSEKFRGPRWLCRCNCGAEITVEGTHLKNGVVKNCGCL